MVMALPKTILRPQNGFVKRRNKGMPKLSTTWVFAMLVVMAFQKTILRPQNGIIKQQNKVMLMLSII